MCDFVTGKSFFVAIMKERCGKSALPLEKMQSVCYNMVRKTRKGACALKHLRTVLTVAVLAVFCFAAIAVRHNTRPADTPEIVFLSVGEGSATLIRTADGDILIDAGPEDAETALCERLSRLGVERFALVIFTHPHEDHIGGGDGILRAFPTDAVWTNGETADSDSYRALMRAIGDVRCETVTAGAFANIGGAVITVLSPAAENDGIRTENENSLVLKIHAGVTDILLMGDAGTETEASLLSRYGVAQLRADILAAGHHGANSAGGTDFLSAVSPSRIVISCGSGNRYGHPDGRALARMEAVCSDIRRTDLEGDIHIPLSADTGEAIRKGE